MHCIMIIIIHIVAESLIGTLNSTWYNVQQEYDLEFSSSIISAHITRACGSEEFCIVQLELELSPYCSDNHEFFFFHLYNDNFVYMQGHITKDYAWTPLSHIWPQIIKTVTNLNNYPILNSGGPYNIQIYQLAISDPDRQCRGQYSEIDFKQYIEIIIYNQRLQLPQYPANTPPLSQSSCTGFLSHELISPSPLQSYSSCEIQLCECLSL